MLETIIESLALHLTSEGYKIEHHVTSLIGIHITHPAHPNLTLSIYPIGPKDTTLITLSLRDSNWDRPHLAHALIDLTEPTSINQLENFLQQHIPCPTS